jgi:hypothetical protein
LLSQFVTEILLALLVIFHFGFESVTLTPKLGLHATVAGSRGVLQLREPIIERSKSSGDFPLDPVQMFVSNFVLCGTVRLQNGIVSSGKMCLALAREGVNVLRQ